MINSQNTKYKKIPVSAVKFILAYWIVAILFFQAARTVFLLFNWKLAGEAGLSESVQSMWHGLPMDISMATYITLPVILLMITGVFVPFFRKAVIYVVYTAAVLFILILIILADIGLYEAWGFRLDATPLAYLKNPREAWASVSHLPWVWGSLLVILLYAGLVYIFSRLIRRGYSSIVYGNRWWSFFFLFFLLPVSIIPLRGGFQLAPINQSTVYFSKQHFANQAAVNATWNLMYSLNHRTDSGENPYAVMDSTQARQIVDSLFQLGGITDSIIDLSRNPKPNVILVIWEGFTRKAVDLKKDGITVTPGFNKLKEEGLWFSNIYASGDRTDKGLAAILSGYPAQPIHSVLKSPVKAAKLPSLPGSFKDHGYNTSFFYGGETEFANIKAYLMQGGFDKFVTVEDFDKNQQNSKWGAHDGVVMEKLLTHLQQERQPFFSSWLTLSSHEPFEIPGNRIIKGNDHESQYLDALHYSDSVIHRFIRLCEQQAWWENTILVIVPDHGNRLPRTGMMEDDFKISMLFLGGAIRKKGVVERMGMQTDLATTLLSQLKIDAVKYTWSRNLTDTSAKAWGFFSFNNGFGFFESSGGVIYDNTGKQVIRQSGIRTPAMEQRGKAVQQVFYQDFLER